MLHFREREKFQKLSGSALSQLMLCRLLDVGLGDCSGGPQDAENGFLVAYKCWCALGALLRPEEGSRIFFLQGAFSGAFPLPPNTICCPPIVAQLLVV